jgi:hypothetical protein
VDLNVDLSDSVLRHLREVVDLPDLTGTRYQLQEEIGRGGLGVVYAARDTQLDRRGAADRAPGAPRHRARVRDGNAARRARVLRHEAGGWASVYVQSRASAKPWHTLTVAACCIATSSRRTSWWAASARSS